MTQPKTQYLKDYRPPEFECLQIHLEFNLDIESTQVTTKSRWRRIGQASDMRLDGENLELLQLQIDGRDVL